MKALNLPETEYRPFSREAYRLAPVLSAAEKEALKGNRGRLLKQHPVPDLIRPLMDIAEASGTGRKQTEVVMMSMLAEMHHSGQPCWQWPQARWLALINQARRGRPLLAGFAWHLADMRDPLSLPGIRKPALYACAIFGQAIFHNQLSRLIGILISLGYARDSQESLMSGILSTLMLMNGSPLLESITTDLLWQVQNCHDRGIFRPVGRVSQGLAALGIISAPVRMRNYVQWHEKPVGEIDPLWVQWCRRWRETSVMRPRTRESLYSFILRCGLWLARAHPEIREPADRTMETCGSFIAAVGRMSVDELQLGTPQGVRRSVRSGEPMMPNSRASFIYSLRRFMSDYENWGWGRLRFSPAHHLTTPDTPLFRCGVNPRVIDDPVWLKLVWASLNLRQEDLLTDIHYPLSLLQAMAVLWTHAGLRRNEILRLTTNCITPQSEEIVREDGSIIPAGTLCWLNVPAGKTSQAFVKPVSVVIKKFIDNWLCERPPEQSALTDERTGEKVSYLFQYRGRRTGNSVINLTLIPVLCARAGVPAEDSRGPITSHRGRASALTALASVPQGMSLYELMQWSGHSTPPVNDALSPYTTHTTCGVIRQSGPGVAYDKRAD